MKISEIKDTLPKKGYVYTIKAKPSSGDYSGLEVYVLGFRGNNTQVKVVTFGESGFWDVDNVDVTGKWALEFDLATMRKPTSEEQKAIEKAEKIQLTLPKEE